MSEIGGWLVQASFSSVPNGFQACSWTHADWDWKGEEVGSTRMFRFPCLTELVVGLRCQREHDKVGWEKSEEAEACEMATELAVGLQSG